VILPIALWVGLGETFVDLDRTCGGGHGLLLASGQCQTMRESAQRLRKIGEEILGSVFGKPLVKLHGARGGRRALLPSACLGQPIDKNASGFRQG